jgi:hypothetical protein
VLQLERVQVVPAVLEADPRADVDQGQVVVEDLFLERDDDDEPGGEGTA